MKKWGHCTWVMSVVRGKNDQFFFDHLFCFRALVVGDYVMDCNLVVEPVSGLRFILIEAGVVLSEVKNHDHRCLWQIINQTGGFYIDCALLFFPLVKAGIFKLAAYKPTVSRTSKPLSAKIKSPGDICQCSVTCLSLTLTPQPFEIHDMVPCGVIQMRYLMGLWDFYVWALALRSLGRSMNILMQSIIQAYFLNLERKESDIEASNTSLSGQTTRSGTSRACITLMVFIKSP